MSDILALIPIGKVRWTDGNGNPLVGGKVFFYVPGTTTPKNTWQDQGGTVLNSNPVTLDARGEAVVWGSGSYRQVVMDGSGNLIWDQVTADLFGPLSDAGGASMIGFQQPGAENVSVSVQKILQAWPIVQSWGATGNGTDDYAHIQAAYNACAGGTLRFPYTGNPYYLSANVVQPASPVSIIVDPGVVFSGPGSLPQATSHGGSTYVGSYFNTAPTNGTSGLDALTLSAETRAQANFIGNGVAFFAGAYSPTGNPNFTGHLWSINTQTTLNASTGTYNAQGIEVDVNNHYQPQAGVGILFSGLGEYSPQAAIEITRANTTSDWNNGIWLRKFVTGILIDGSSSAAPSTGISVSGIPQNHVVLTPATSAALTNPVLQINAPGSSTQNLVGYASGALRIGNGSNTITQVNYSHFNGLAPGTIAANSTMDMTVTMGNAMPGTTSVMVAPFNSALPAGLTVIGWVSAANTVTLRFANVTNSPITVSSINVLVTAITTGT